MGSIAITVLTRKNVVFFLLLVLSRNSETKAQLIKINTIKPDTNKGIP